MLLLVSLHPVFGFSSHSKSSSNDMTPSGSKSSTSATTPQTPSIKTLASKAVITCVNSTIKNALIDALINKPISKCKRFYMNRSYICKSYYDRYNELYQQQQNREWINKQLKAISRETLNSDLIPITFIVS
jgi:hypothetical protein